MLAKVSSARLFALLRRTLKGWNRGPTVLVRLGYTPAWELLVLARLSSASLDALRDLLGNRNRGLTNLA